MATPRRIDITGQRFGRWTVVDFDKVQNETAHWNCVCDCGGTNSVSSSHLRRGTSVSCGCYHKEAVTKHGYSSRRDPDIYRAFKAYSGMLKRVDPNGRDATNYYDRGISITDARWLDSVENFIEDMGPCAKGLSLDRINNDKGYSKENCRWATDSEQMTNKRDSRVTPEIFGIIKREIADGLKNTHIGRLHDVSRTTIAHIRNNQADYCTRPEYLAAI